MPRIRHDTKRTPEDLLTACTEDKRQKKLSNRFCSLTYPQRASTSAKLEGTYGSVKIWPLSGSQHVFNDRNMGSSLVPVLKSQPCLIRRQPLSTAPKSWCLSKTSIAPKFEVIQQPEANSTSGRMPHHVAILSIATDISRQIASSRKIFYATLSSYWSKAVLQLSKQLKIATEHPKHQS